MGPHAPTRRAGRMRGGSLAPPTRSTALIRDNQRRLAQSRTLCVTTVCVPDPAGQVTSTTRGWSGSCGMLEYRPGCTGGSFIRIGAVRSRPRRPAQHRGIKDGPEAGAGITSAAWQCPAWRDTGSDRQHVSHQRGRSTSSPGRPWTGGDSLWSAGEDAGAPPLSAAQRSRNSPQAPHDAARQVPISDVFDTAREEVRYHLLVSVDSWQQRRTTCPGRVATARPGRPGS